MFQREDFTLFRSLTTIGQKAGVPRERLARLVFKELADNALDAGGSVRVRLTDANTGYVEDDGPGIPLTVDEIAAIFSFNRPLISGKLFRLPTRGALGNGLRVVAGAVHASQGSLIVQTLGKIYHLHTRDDGHTDVGDIELTDDKATRVTVTLGAGLMTADRDVLYYAQQAARMTGEKTYKGKTSAHWYDEETFYELFQAAGNTTVEMLLRQFEGVKGPVLEAIEQLPCPLDIATRAVPRDKIGEILGLLRRSTEAVKPSRLGVVGKSYGGAGYAKTEATYALPKAYGDHTAWLPAVIEVWATPLPDKNDDPIIVAYVNRTPIAAPIQSWTTKGHTAIKGGNLCHRFKSGRRPMFYRINVQTPYMPIVTDGKEPDFKPLCNEILETLGKAARIAARTLPSGEKVRSQKDVIIRNLPAAIAKASGPRNMRFSLRQLFYAVRPFVIEDCDKELDYNYFAQVVTDYEGDLGKDIPNIYRDSRGSLYHPHTHEVIPLGTRQVEQYRRPAWTFKRLLYCEKEGFAPILSDSKFLERHDLALLTSKGFASRAARDVVDLLGDDDTEGELIVLAAHDADGPGSLILQSLVGATRARAARRVKVINLGLDPEEGLAMGLEVEKVDRKRGKVPVADYLVGTEWEEWLQGNRIELNAMTSPQFLDWLDKKITDYEGGKLIPPINVLRNTLTENVRSKIAARLTAEAVRDAHVAARTDEAVAEINPEEYDENDLTAHVDGELAGTPEERWDAPVERLAEELVGKS